MTLVTQQPGIQLRELQTLLYRDYTVNIGLSTIFQILHKNGFSRQRMVLIAEQRDEYLMTTYELLLQWMCPAASQKCRCSLMKLVQIGGTPCESTVIAFEGKSHKLLIRAKSEVTSSLFEANMCPQSQ